jgi:hypothetical protein
MSSSHVHLTPTAPSFASQSESESHHDSAAAAAETVLSVQHVSSHMCSLIILMKSACVMVNWERGVNRVSLRKCTLAIERHADTNLRLWGCSFAAKLAVLFVRGRQSTSSTANFSMYIVRSVLTGLATATPEGAREDALRLYTNAHYVEAAAKWRQAIERGDVTSHAELAWLLSSGRHGVQGDPKAAFELARVGLQLGCMHCSGVVAVLHHMHSSKFPMFFEELMPSRKYDFRVLANQSAAAGSR